MANVNGVLGSGTGTNDDFIAGTRVWAGGYTPASTPAVFSVSDTYSTGNLVVLQAGDNTVWRAVGTVSAGAWSPTQWTVDGVLFDTTENINAANGDTVTAEDCTIVCNGIQGSGNQRLSASGRYEFTNMNWHLNNISGNNNSKIAWIFTDITVVKSGDTSAVIGNWDSGSGNDVARWEINGMNVYGDLNSSDATLTTINVFPLRLDADSFVNGLNLWNNKLVTDPECRGAGLASGNIVYSSLVTGPFGSIYPGGPTNIRGILRFGVGGGSHTDTGWLLSHDFRSVQDADSGTTDGFKFLADFGGRPFWINPLVGEPTDAIRCGQGYGGGQAGHFRTVIASLPQSTADDVKYVNADTDVTMYSLPNTFTPNSVLTEIPTDIVTHTSGTGDADNGLAFFIQDEQTTTSAGAATAPLWIVPTEKQYRSYSFQQDDWGTTRSVTPTVSGADNPTRDADRLSGAYPEVNGDGIVNGLDVNAPADLITAGFATAAAATTALHVVGGATNPRDVVASIKTAHYNGITTDVVNLPYTRSGSTVTFDSNTPIELSSTASVAPVLSGTRIVPCSSIDINTVEAISALVAPDWAFIGNVLSGTNNKATIEATGTTGINALNQTINNVSLTTTNALSTIDITGSTSASGLSISAAGAVNASGAGTLAGASIQASNLNNVTASKLGSGNTYIAPTGGPGETLNDYLARAAAANASDTLTVISGLPGQGQVLLSDAGLSNVSDFADVRNIDVGETDTSATGLLDQTALNDVLWIIKDANNYGRYTVTGGTQDFHDTLSLAAMDSLGSVSSSDSVTIIIDQTGFNADDANNLKNAAGEIPGGISPKLTIEFAGITASSTVNAIDILSDGTGYSTTGDVTLASETAITVQLTADDVSKLDVEITQGGSDVTVGNVTYTFPLEATIETYTILAPRNGRYAVRQTKAGVETELVAPTDLVSGTNVPITVSDFSSTTTGTGFTTGDSVKVFVKYDSDVATQDIYVERAFTYTFGGGSQTAELTAEPQVLVGPMTASSGGTFAFSTDQGTTRFLQVSGRTTQVENQNESQGFGATIANHNDHFQAWYENDTGLPLASYGVGSVFWDTDVITGTSGDTGDESLPGAGGSGTVTANVTRSQVMTRWFKNVNSSGPSTLFRNVTGPEWTILNSGNPPLGDVVTAVNIGIDTNTKVENIEIASGYTVNSIEDTFGDTFDKDSATNLTPFE